MGAGDDGIRTELAQVEAAIAELNERRAKLRQALQILEIRRHQGAQVRQRRTEGVRCAKAQPDGTCNHVGRHVYKPVEEESNA